jgi:hypothetical protein
LPAGAQLALICCPQASIKRTSRQGGRMYTVSRRVGRLVEIRVAPPITVSEAIAFAEALQSLVDGMNSRFVACSDFSRINILPPEIVMTYATCMRSLNTRLHRTGILVAKSATFGLQIARLVKDAGNPNRRSFTDAHDLKLWLAETLTREEQTRLAEFLASP